MLGKGDRDDGVGSAAGGVHLGCGDGSISTLLDRYLEPSSINASMDL